MRARERPTVSTPVGWDEVEHAAEKDDAACSCSIHAAVLERSRSGATLRPGPRF
jgi:DNA primase